MTISNKSKNNLHRKSRDVKDDQSDFNLLSRQ